MSIQPLPKESVRSLGSTQVITSPLTVLKELIENSLDAQTTTITIEAAPDLLSHIIVKDNGLGISEEDRPLMAMAHCTSKISDFDDIVGVTTLGFRGEALASAAAVSGALVISTRTQKEAVGTVCEIGKDGKIMRQSSTPMPRGTTVKVANLFANVPVRKASIEKSVGKLLPQIRHLLTSYFLTHPGVRFSFKLTAPATGHSAKKKIETKYDVVFAPSKNCEEAIMKSVGKDVFSSGKWITHASIGEEQIDNVKVESFLVKPDAEPQSISRKGVFISFHNRPLSIERASTAKDIYSLYKKFVKANSSSSDQISEPFLFFNLLTGRDAADVNVEPAKDDILFSDNDKILHAVQQCFEEVYGPLPAVETRKHDSKSSSKTDITVEGSDFNVLMSGRSRHKSNAPEQSSDIPPISSEGDVNEDVDVPMNDILTSADVNVHGQDAVHRMVKPKEKVQEPRGQTNDEESASTKENTPQPNWSFNMYDHGDVDADIAAAEKESFFLEDNDEQERDTIHTSNPWVISKLNSRVYPEGAQDKANAAAATPASKAKTTNTHANDLLTPTSANTTPRRLDTESSGDRDKTDSRKSKSEVAPIFRTPASNRKPAWYPSFGNASSSSRQLNRENRESIASRKFIPLTRPFEQDGTNSLSQTRSIDFQRQRKAMQVWLQASDSSPAKSSANKSAKESDGHAPPAPPLFDKTVVDPEVSPSRRSNRGFTTARRVYEDQVSSEDEVENNLHYTANRLDPTSFKKNLENVERLSPSKSVDKRQSPHRNRQKAATAALTAPVATQTAEEINDKLLEKLKPPTKTKRTRLVEENLHNLSLTLREVNNENIARSKLLVEPLWYGESIPLTTDVDELASSLTTYLRKVANGTVLEEPELVEIKNIIYGDGLRMHIEDVDNQEDVAVLTI